MKARLRIEKFLQCACFRHVPDRRHIKCDLNTGKFRIKIRADCHITGTIVLINRALLKEKGHSRKGEEKVLFRFPRLFV